jgi:hypothetical protein
MITAAEVRRLGGIQESLFDSPRFQFVDYSVRRVKGSFETARWPRRRTSRIAGTCPIQPARRTWRSCASSGSTPRARAGFKRTWAERDYRRIIKAAQRLPESVLQEEPGLLMYYDNALMRAETEPVQGRLL